jgi:hypothetical protein
MTEAITTLPWHEPQWIEQAHAWIRQRLTDNRLTLTSPIDQFHAQIWSTVMRVPTSDGQLYFKASHTPNELRMVLFLKEYLPENLPEFVAVEHERGWMLMHDAGPQLRAYFKTPEDLTQLDPALVMFAGLQMQVAGIPPEQLLDLGSKDRRLEHLPDMFGKLLGEPEILRLGEEDGLTDEQFQRVCAFAPRYREMCQALLNYKVPQTLHHDDFHAGNIFVSGQPGDFKFIFSDWEETSFAHPFFSIMQCLRSVASSAGYPDEATDSPERMPAELNRLRDVYLQPWQRYESAEDLLEIFNQAWRVGCISRALTWREFVLGLPPEQRTDFTYIVPAWLGEFLLAMD